LGAETTHILFLQMNRAKLSCQHHQPVSG